MTRKLATILAVAGLVCGMGCQHSQVDAHYGDALRDALARSTDDPDGSLANADEPAPQGLDGMSAEAAMSSYRRAQQPQGGGPRLPMIVTDTESLGSR